MKQLQAGYIFDFVKNKLLSENKSSEVLSLLESLSYFEVDSTLTETIPNDKPELAVLNNLLSRGLPTRPSSLIEDIFLNSLAIGEQIPDVLGNIETLTNNSFNPISQYLFKALHIIDPRIIPDRRRFQIQQSFEFANIGSRRLTTIAATMEQAGKKRDQATLTSQLVTIFEEFTRLTKLITLRIPKSKEIDDETHIPVDESLGESEPKNFRRTARQSSNRSRLAKYFANQDN